MRKRTALIQAIDMSTGEVLYTSINEFNREIPEHKKRFMEICERFYNTHFINLDRFYQLRISFPDYPNEADLPF